MTGTHCVHGVMEGTAVRFDRGTCAYMVFIGSHTVYVYVHCKLGGKVNDWKCIIQIHINKEIVADDGYVVSSAFSHRIISTGSFPGKECENNRYLVAHVSRLPRIYSG